MDADPTENPTNEERKQRLLTRFEGWHEPIPTLMASTSAESISSIPIFDRKPSDQWVDGPVTLLGDAAHPLTMNIGQGVALGIEDALELGNCLRREESVEQALETYHRRRSERTTEIVNRSWRLGRLASTENPLVCAFRDYVLFPRFGGLQLWQVHSEKFVHENFATKPWAL